MKSPPLRSHIKLQDPLFILTVIDRLEIGPVRVEKNRLIAPYKVIQKKHTDSIDLIYKYEENVFDPNEAASLNIANIIAAQVAINYGLFCRQIIFHGEFDRHDRKLITNMAENTAREIYVKKFLEPNPFLMGKAAKLPAIKMKSYLRSKIIFKSKANNLAGKSWETSQDRYAVLSSGGKDSLLSFGLLDELGFKTHPIYINESGRHWHTALNSYRYMKSQYPMTSKVWTNADRVFNWMLRHMPIIRQDFSRLRADEYPIRLWTVAVFIFGALPLIKKRGIGRIIIGNEYDTTRRMRHKEIPHYDGLYDQSRFFDNALSSYYRAKGWGLHQFSIIRPLSELMIQKILTYRYPKLQKQQVSCHATHIVGHRVLPCGDCEKCRRIAGMLMALDADPQRCGYTNKQAAKILADLASTKLRQDAHSADQLLKLLAEKGLLEPGPYREHHEIMSLKFDTEKSLPSDIPEDLRHKLISIYLKYANGIVRKNGKKWALVNPRKPF